MRRTAYAWERRLELRVPVHDVSRWTSRPVIAALHDVLGFLTGDRWHITFGALRRAAEKPQQGTLSLPSGVVAVIPYSNGLDSCAVSGLMANELGASLVRIRLGTGLSDSEEHDHGRHPFTAVPYKVRGDDAAFVESSARSRGFKFALISGLAAYLANAGRVIVPESGQGSLGSSLVPVGQAYEDCRSHPLFTARMEAFLAALLGHHVRFEFPRLWHTKGETLGAFAKLSGDRRWASTWSCWRQNRHVSVDGKRRQCGVCAAWQITRASREYAIAGALHLDHVASLAGSAADSGALDLAAYQLARPLGLSREDARQKLERFLEQHRAEWEDFMRSLGPNSFVADWAMRGRS